MTAPNLPAEPSFMRLVRIQGTTPVAHIDKQICDYIDALRSQLTAALALLAEREANDRRYRILREQHPVLLLTGFFGNGCVNRTIEEVDAALDAMDPTKVKS